jgi:hypothetical protein
LNADDRGNWKFRERSSSVPAVNGDFVTVGIEDGGARSDAATINIK